MQKFKLLLGWFLVVGGVGMLALGPAHLPAASPFFATQNNQPAFTPLSLPSLMLWLHADSMALSDGTAVSQWLDNSGSGNNFAQPTGALQPHFKVGIANGLPVVRYANEPSRLLGSVTLPASFTMSFTLIPRGNGATYNALFPTDAGDNGPFIYLGVSTWYAGGPHQGSASLSLGTAYTITYVATGGGMQIYLNGVADGASFSTGTLAGDVLKNLGSDPAGDNSDVDMGEVVMCGVALTQAQITNLYLYEKRFGTN